jgi:hypothetical protein
MTTTCAILDSSSNAHSITKLSSIACVVLYYYTGTPASGLPPMHTTLYKALWLALVRPLCKGRANSNKQHHEQGNNNDHALHGSPPYSASMIDEDPPSSALPTNKC